MDAQSAPQGSQQSEISGRSLRPMYDDGSCLVRSRKDPPGHGDTPLGSIDGLGGCGERNTVVRYVTAMITLPRLCPLSTYLCASTMLSRA